MKTHRIKTAGHGMIVTYTLEGKSKSEVRRGASMAARKDGMMLLSCELVKSEPDTCQLALAI